MTTGSIDSVDRIIVQADERLPAVLQIIDAARRRLDLSIFRCDEPAVLEALGRAAARGVHVRALVTGKAKGSKAQLKQLRKALKASGVEVRRYADPIVRYHAKYVVADEHTAMVASLNFTKKCFGQTCDFMLVSSDAALVGVLAQLFEADWAGIGIAEGDAGRLIIGPEQARARFTALLSRAVRSIRLIDPKITDPAVLVLLRKREAEGIEVDVRSRTGLGRLVAHGKLLIVDDTAAAIGSISLSTMALEFRRELAVVTHDSQSIAVLEDFWKSLPEVNVRPATGGISLELS